MGIKKIKTKGIWTSLLVLWLCLFFTNKAFSQTVNFNFPSELLTERLNKISKVSKAVIAFDANAIDVRVNALNAKYLTVDQMLANSLGSTGLYYKKISEGSYVIVKMQHMSQKNDKNKNVSGIITNKNGEPIIGANVMEKSTNGTGTITGTVSDLEGKYSLSVSSFSEITVSCLGYKTKKIKVGSGSVLDIVLEDAAHTLSDVVVVGYGTQKKVNVTGAVDQVTSEVFENRSVTNVTQALQGAVPNLNITLKDGKPTRSADYNIRGTTSIGQGGSALVLIDGVEGDPAMLNPNDISSVSVLKDAASAAIYGARGAFGVVLITTKNPVENKTTVSYTGNFTMQSPVDVPDLVTDGYTYARMFLEAYSAWNNYSATPKNINKTQSFTTSWLDTFKSRKEQGITGEVETDANGNYIYYGNTDYYKELYKDHVFAQDHNLSVTGSSGKISYYVTGRYYDYDGLFRYNTDDYQMLNLRAKGSIKVNDYLTIDNNMDFSNMDYHNPTNIGEGGSIWRNLSDEGHPSEPIFNPDGSLTMSAAYTIGDFIYGKNGIDTKNNVLKNTIGFTVSFLDNKLHIKGDFTFRNTNEKMTERRVPVPYSNTVGKTVLLGSQYNDLKESDLETNYLATNIYSEYENTFAESHYFKGMVGYNYEQSRYKSLYVQRNGLLTEDSKNINMALGESINTSGNYNKWRIAGGFFRLNYGYKDRYLLEVNGRYDGSSKFPTNEQWAFFPSVSAGYRISEEPFWHVNDNLFSDLKIRASYGSLGNGNINPYSFMELFSINTSGRVLNGAKNKYTSAPAVLPDGLTWEKATTSNIGLDFGMLKRRLQFSGDAYIRKTTDMYTVGVTLPEVFGAGSPKGNYADMTTKGWEITLKWKDNFRLANKPFNYEVRATLADYTSKIDRYNNSTKSLGDYYEGQTVGEIWGYETEGLFTSQEDIDSHASQKLFKSSTKGIWYPGDVKMKDLDGNKVIDYGTNTLNDHGDLKVIGNSLPRYSYSFNLSADWNNIFISVFFQGVGRQNWYPSSECVFWGQYNRPYNNIPKWHLNNYWTKDNTDAYFPRYAGYNTSIRDTKQTRYLQNIAYIRLKNLQIGYNLPKQIISKAKMQSARIYLSGENLWCWSPLYKHTRDIDVASIYGSDPDLTDGNSGNGNNYPVMSSVSLGLSVTF